MTIRYEIQNLPGAVVASLVAQQLGQVEGNLSLREQLDQSTSATGYDLIT